VALRASVRDELARLLNTRSFPSGAGSDLVQGTVLGYGLPDFSASAPASSEDRQRLGDAIAERIAAYEPRLCEVRVTLDPLAGNPTAVAGVIEASLRVGSVYEPVAFQMTMDREAAQGSGAERVSVD
jgi:type VI secretion system lysozyme-like protein